MGRFRVAALLATAAVAILAACSGSGDEARAVCARDGAASVCLGSDRGTAYELSGKGFQPGSEVALDVASGAGRMIPVDGEGRFPPANAALGFLPGPDREEHLLEGVDAAGQPVAFTVTCALTEAKQPTCGF